MKSVTLAEVARAAGVSTSLASLVLSGKAEGRCSVAKEAKVKAAAKNLGYRTNRLARSLKEQTTRTLGLLSVEVATTPYAGEMLLAAQRVARSHDYDLFFVEVENDPKSIAEAFDLLSEHQVVGTILATYFHYEIKLPRTTPKNIVFANCFPSRGGYSAFVPAEYKSYMQGLKLLGIAGHKNVGMLIDDANWPAVIGREKAFLDAALHYGWSRPSERIYRVPGASTNGGYKATLEMMVREPEITAIACYHDGLALGAYQALRDLNLTIPDQVSVVAFDDLELISGGLRPGLTTVRLPHYQMGRDAVEHLIRICEGSDDKPKQVVEIQGELVVRESVSVPRQLTNASTSADISTESIEKEEK